MRFAIVGETSETADIVASVHSHDGHEVTHAALLDDSSVLFGKMPSLRRVGQWEDLLGDDSIDVVVVAGDEDQVLPPARQIAGTGRPLVVVPSPGMTSAFAYELSLVRDENLVPLYPVLPHRLDPAAGHFRDLVNSGELGELIQFRFEREVAAPILNPATVETWLLPDADLLRWVSGAFTQVTALYQGSTEDGFASATVNLAGDSATDTSWTLTRSANPKWKLTASGTKGQFVLKHDGTSSILRDDQVVDLPDGRQASSPTDWLTCVPSAISKFLGGETTPAEQSAVWTDFTRSNEIVDAHRRSIKRRRTIDMHFETLSERSQFKTQMSAMGCGVLTYTLFGLVAYLIVAGAFAPGDGASDSQQARFAMLCNIARVVWLLPLGVFLASQLLLIIARPPAKTVEEPADVLE
ncbi:MAG: hypothetical protein AB8G99_24590 [Planctomycetaceae bacterium]